jgi:DNA-binding transcriptional ArsR family regulator
MADQTTAPETVSSEIDGQSGTEPKISPKSRKVKSPKGKGSSPRLNVVPAVPNAKATKGKKTAIQDVLRYRDAAVILKQAADPTRLQVLLLLGEGERHVGAICESLGGISQPAASHHLALMRHARLIQPTRRGKNNFYMLTSEGQRLVNAISSLVES